MLEEYIVLNINIVTCSEANILTCSKLKGTLPFQRQWHPAF